MPRRTKQPARLVLKSVVIHQLRSLAVELKKTPTAMDIAAGARRNRCPSLNTVRTAFGTVTLALKAAKLPTRRHQEFTREQLIQQLRDLSRALGRPLTRKDVKKAGKAGTCARLVTFARVFGTPRDAFREAGVSRFRRFTREELISQYRSLARELRKTPTIEEINVAARKGRMGASYTTVRHVCGDFTKFRRDAGLDQNARRRYTPRQLLDQLKRLADKLGRTPFCPDVNAASRRGECASTTTFMKYFGSYNRGVREAGLQVARRTSYSRDELIGLLRGLAARLGRSPSIRDIHRSSRQRQCASVSLLISWFGSLNAAFKAAGLERAPNITPQKRPKKYTRAQFIEHLNKLSAKLGRSPTTIEVAAASRNGNGPSMTAIAKEFGTLTAALQAAGHNAESRYVTRERLVDQLRRLTRELKRIPSTGDIARARGCSKPATFKKFFGSAAAARKAAGLDDVLREMGIQAKHPKAREKHERDFLIKYLRSLATELGKPPSVSDIAKACREGRGPGVGSYAKEFGGIPAARERAKIEEVLKNLRKPGG
ncbi:MAG TPA: hypothetical protein VFV34_11400 [Blastocatellia bacterium]|nr:hypothetical protein [Blastocatellia bacterium]